MIKLVKFFFNKILRIHSKNKNNKLGQDIKKGMELYLGKNDPAFYSKNLLILSFISNLNMPELTIIKQPPEYIFIDQYVEIAIQVAKKGGKYLWIGPGVFSNPYDLLTKFKPNSLGANKKISVCYIYPSNPPNKIVYITTNSFKVINSPI